MTWYVVVTRDTGTPISRHPTVEDAGNKIVREMKFDLWTVKAQDGSATKVARALNKTEKARLERTLWPGLFE